MPRAPEDAYAELISLCKDWNLLASCSAVLGWDERTHMPRRGSAHRAEQTALIARLVHERTTSPKIGDLLGEVEASSLVSDPLSPAAVNARELRRTFDRASKLPQRLVEELARVTTRAQQAWQDARTANDFASYKPWLEKVVALKVEEASAVGFTDSPYDALLDEYEAGATAAQITKTFAALREELVPLVGQITSSGRQPNREILEREFPVDRQQIIAEAAAAAIGFDFDAGRLDPTAHPFCTTIGPGDVRILTRYNARHFSESFFGTLHEAGHGVYEQGLPEEHFGTPRGSAASLGVHESQSRLWENLVGRGHPFWEHFFPRARQVFHAALRGVTLDEFYFAVNDVRPSFIRVESDEATYNLHIILRFELEQPLLTGDLKVGDVPAAWNEKFATAFGITPPDDAKGCLQDVHWAMGGIGYFPTYTLGNMYAAQFMEKARADLGNLDADFRRGEFGRLKTWLNHNVHRHGQSYRPADLCVKVTGQPRTHAPLLRHLRSKYAALYGLAT